MVLFVFGVDFDLVLGAGFVVYWPTGLGVHRTENAIGQVIGRRLLVFVRGFTCTPVILIFGFAALGDGRRWPGIWATQIVS